MENSETSDTYLDSVYQSAAFSLYFSTAKEVEAIVRAEGAIPATIGILEGRIHVGLSSDELDFLAQSKTALKVSRRDLPYVISKVWNLCKIVFLNHVNIHFNVKCLIFDYAGSVGWHYCLRHNDCRSQSWDSCLCNRRHWRST